MLKLWSLLALVALLVAPLSMAAAPASAAAHHGATAAMPTEHCPDKSGKADTTGAIPECAMACSGALPAADLLQAEARTVPQRPLEAPLARSLAGVQPDIATPPPKRS